MGPGCPSLSAWQAQPCLRCGLPASTMPALVPLLRCQSSGPAPSAPSSLLHHLSLSQGSSCLHLTQSASAAGNGQELWRIGTTQRKGATGGQHPQRCSLPPLHRLQLSTAAPYDLLGMGRTGNEVNCTPKTFPVPGSGRLAGSKMLSSTAVLTSLWSVMTRYYHVFNWYHPWVPARHLDTRLLPQATDIQLLFCKASLSLANEN